MVERYGTETAAEKFLDFVESLSATNYTATLQHASNADTLQDLASKLGCEIDQLHKTVCLNYKDETGRHLIAVVLPATAKVDMNKVAATLGISAKVKAAQPDFITDQTGFVPGGIPPMGFEAIRLIDASVLTHNLIFAGGGNNLNLYSKIDPRLLIELYPDTIIGSFLI